MRVVKGVSCIYLPIYFVWASSSESRQGAQFNNSSSLGSNDTSLGTIISTGTGRSGSHSRNGSSATTHYSHRSRSPIASRVTTNNQSTYSVRTDRSSSAGKWTSKLALNNSNWANDTDVVTTTSEKLRRTTLSTPPLNKHTVHANSSNTLTKGTYTLSNRSTTYSIRTPLSNSTTCPTTVFPEEYPVAWRTFDDQCKLYDATLGNPYFYNYADRCLASWCASSSLSALAEAYKMPRTELTTYTYKHMGFYYTTFNGTSTLMHNSTLWVSYETATKAAMDVMTWARPCCGVCTLRADAIHFYFWPDQATAGETDAIRSVAQSSRHEPTDPHTYVDDTGFTYISPSVYLALTSLRATDHCSTIGEVLASTTIAFDLSEISTLGTVVRTFCTSLSENMFSHTDGFVLYETAQVMTLANLVQNCSTISGYYYNEDDPQMYMYERDPCHPYIEIPTRIKSLHPGWLPCYAGWGGGFYDPPRTLHQGNFLVPTTVQSSSVSTDPPAPGQSVSNIPSRTQTPYSSSSKSDREPERSETTSTPNTVSSFIADSAQSTSITVVTVIIPTEPDQRSSDTTTAAWPTSLKASSEEAEKKTLTTFPGDPDPIIVTLDETSRLSMMTVRPVLRSDEIWLIVDDQTLKPGAEITVGGVTSSLSKGGMAVAQGTRVYLDASGFVVFAVGTSTIERVSIPSLSMSTNAPVALVVFDFKGKAYTKSLGGSIVIEGKTLFPGSVVTIDGTQLSLDSAATKIAINDAKTVALHAANVSNISRATLVFTLGERGQLTYQDKTLNPGSTIIINGITQFEPNGGINVFGGTTLSLDRDGASIFVNGTAKPLPWGLQTPVDAATTIPRSVTTFEQSLATSNNIIETVKSTESGEAGIAQSSFALIGQSTSSASTISSKGSVQGFFEYIQPTKHVVFLVSLVLSIL